MRRRKTTVGVDIGSGFSKAVVIDHGESGPRLTGLATVPTAPDTVRGGTIRDPERVADTLSALFKRVSSDPDLVVNVGPIRSTGQILAVWLPLKGFSGLPTPAAFQSFPELSLVGLLITADDRVCVLPSAKLAQDLEG